jgi:hypothetical protein
MSRSDLKDPGELLDAGTSGLIVVAATDVEGRAEATIQHGKTSSRSRSRSTRTD